MLTVKNQIAVLKYSNTKKVGFNLLTSHMFVHTENKPLILPLDGLTGLFYEGLLFRNVGNLNCYTINMISL